MVIPVDDDAPLTGNILTWGEWHTIYRRIVADFGFDSSLDRQARDMLSERIGSSGLELDDLPSYAGEVVTIAGAAPTLESDLGQIDSPGAVIAASSAAGICESSGVAVDLVVTDLDGDPARAAAFTHDDIPVVVHAHGDNRRALDEWVSQMNHAYVFPTTQTEPRGRVWNVGGFTDGDRAVYLTCALGATRYQFIGWDFEDAGVDPIKKKKLAWAERLLSWLERRQHIHLPVLNDRRNSVDLTDFPDPEQKSINGP